MDGDSRSPGSRSAAGSTCGSFTAPTTPSPPTWPGSGTATWAASAHWRCGSTRWDSRPWNGVRGATRCGGYTRPCSGYSRWNPSRSTPACSGRHQGAALVAEKCSAGHFRGACETVADLRGQRQVAVDRGPVQLRQLHLSALVQVRVVRDPDHGPAARGEVLLQAVQIHPA